MLWARVKQAVRGANGWPVLFPTLISCVSSLVLAACSTAQPTGLPAHITAAESNVVIGNISGAPATRLYIDDIFVTEIQTRKYVNLALQPGEYVFALRRGAFAMTDQDKARIRVRAGERHAYNIGKPTTTSVEFYTGIFDVDKTTRLNAVNPERFETELKRCCTETKLKSAANPEQAAPEMSSLEKSE